MEKIITRKLFSIFLPPTHTSHFLLAHFWMKMMEKEFIMHKKIMLINWVWIFKRTISFVYDISKQREEKERDERERVKKVYHFCQREKDRKKDKN